MTTTKQPTLRTHLRRLDMAIQTFEMWEATKATSPDGTVRLTYAAAVSIPLETAKAVADGLSDLMESHAKLHRRCQQAERHTTGRADVRCLEEKLASKERELVAVKASLRRVTAQRDMAREALRERQLPVTE